MKLSKEQLKQKADLVEKLQMTYAAYYAAVQEANDFINCIYTEFEDEFNQKSERWQESEKGLACYEFIQDWGEGLEEPEDLSGTLAGLSDGANV